MKQLGFKGALINGHTRDVYLDDECCLPFWERVAALDVPIYLHPANPMVIPAAFEGYPGLAQALFGWAAETGGHALRLVLSGLILADCASSPCTSLGFRRAASRQRTLAKPAVARAMLGPFAGLSLAGLDARKDTIYSFHHQRIASSPRSFSKAVR